MEEIEEIPINLRDFLIDLSEKGEISAKVSTLKKAKEEVQERIYLKYQAEQLQQTNSMLCDLVIGKFGELMEMMNLVKSGSETSQKLQQKKIFMNDFEKFMLHVTPYIPFVGFLEGGLSIAEDMGTRVMNTSVFPKPCASEQEPEEK